MEHKYWEERLQGFIDNELGPADRIAVQTHVDECPICKVNLKYFQCLKERLRAHGKTVRIPQAVDDRLHRLFVKKRNPWRQPRYIGIALAAAAVLLIGFLLPQMFGTPYAFIDNVMTGKVICHDCEVAARAGLEKGSICSDGHEMGLVTTDGKIWRFAGDDTSLKYANDSLLYGKAVRIYGQALFPERLIRIKNLELITESRASLTSPKGP